MLTLYHNNQEIPLETTEYYVRELASGLDEVIFDISIWDPNYALMAEEENIVDRGGQRYLIKQIDAGAVTAKVVCQLDLDDWKATLAVGYNSGSKTVYQQIAAVAPSGWSVSDFSYISISRTIKGDLTPLQVCEDCRDTYKVYIRWNTKTKVCSIYSQQMGSPVGAFATRELNLKEINYKGKSTNFATRLYAYGKDGLSFADINDGHPYVDNNTYSNRIICAYWQDERYTDKTSLLNDARANLAKIAVPERSYDCAIIDLHATNPEKYNNLDFSLFTAATLIDDVKDTAVDYMVVERHVWPYHPELNDVIFNSAPIKIQNTVLQIEEELTDPSSTFAQRLQAEINLVTDWLTNANSHVYIVQNDDETIKEFIFVNGNQPIETATQVMRLNSAGLGFSKTGVNGPFTNAFVFDSERGGHLVADFITSGHMLADRIEGGTLESVDSTTIGGVTYKNFSLNMNTGLLNALKLAIKTPNFTLTESGVATSFGPRDPSWQTHYIDYSYVRTVINSGVINVQLCNAIDDAEANVTTLLSISAKQPNYTLFDTPGAISGARFSGDLSCYGFTCYGDVEVGNGVVPANFIFFGNGDFKLIFGPSDELYVNQAAAYTGTITDVNNQNYKFDHGICMGPVAS